MRRVWEGGGSVYSCRSPVEMDDGGDGSCLRVFGSLSSSVICLCEEEEDVRALLEREEKRSRRFRVSRFGSLGLLSPRTLEVELNAFESRGVVVTECVSQRGVVEWTRMSATSDALQRWVRSSR